MVGILEVNSSVTSRKSLNITSKDNTRHVLQCHPPTLPQPLEGGEESDVRLVMVGDVEVQVDVGELQAEPRDRAAVQADGATRQVGLERGQLDRD